MNRKYITINIHNDPEILQLIVDTIPYMPGWKLCDNANKTVQIKAGGWTHYRNKTASYFTFNIVEKLFVWEVTDEGGSKMKSLYIRNLEHISRIMDKIYEATVNNTAPGDYDAW